jgi:hypothetical protein
VSVKEVVAFLGVLCNISYSIFFTYSVEDFLLYKIDVFVRVKCERWICIQESGSEGQKFKK